MSGNFFSKFDSEYFSLIIFLKYLLILLLMLIFVTKMTFLEKNKICRTFRAVGHLGTLHTSTGTLGKTDHISPAHPDYRQDAQSRQLVGFPRFNARDRISFGMAQNGTCKYFCLYSNYSNNDNDYMRKKMMK